MAYLHRMAQCREVVTAEYNISLVAHRNAACFPAEWSNDLRDLRSGYIGTRDSENTKN